MTRKISLDDRRLGEGHSFDPGTTRVRFPIDPPTYTTPEGQRVRMVDEEGWIDVTCTRDGGLLIRAASPLRIEPGSSNSVVVRLLDAEVST